MLLNFSAMRLLCFQAKRFRWKTHSKTLAEVPDREAEEDVGEALVVFLHAEASDETSERRGSALRQTLKHVKWLANKRGMKNVVLHSFAHLGGASASAAFTESFMSEVAGRLGDTGYSVRLTPFGYFCEWDLSVYGDSLAKVWKEIR
jgi:threonyl-tRNA synthetase editing subunit